MKAAKLRCSIFRLVFAGSMALAFILAPLSSRIAAQEGQTNGGYVIRRDVNLAVFPTTILDKKGQFVTDLPPESFSVFENNIPQKLAIAKHEDVSVSVGLVIDNSGSMREKREGVNVAALTFVETSNPYDEMFVVNFNDDIHLDQKFTSSAQELKDALERVESRGNTALYDAIVGSMDYLHKDGKRDKKVLLVVTDGEDRASRFTLERAILELQKSDVIVYAVGILSEDERSEARHAKKALERLAEATGGLAFFPENNPAEIAAVCEIIARDIRNQYTIAYYSSISATDQKFRDVKIQVKDPNKRSLTVRHRPGYFPKPAPAKK